MLVKDRESINFKKIDSLQKKGIKKLYKATYDYLKAWYMYYEVYDDPEDDLIEEFVWRYRLWIQDVAVKTLKSR